MMDLIQPQPHDIALDAATGAGHTALALANHIRKVIAIDITGEMLLHASEMARKRGILNIDFILQDIHYLGWADGFFDIVACRFAAHHFVDTERAVQEMSRVLKPGGRLYILDCSFAGEEDTGRFINKMERLRDNSHAYSHSKTRWRELLNKTHLHIEHMVLERKEYDICQWFETIGTPEAQRQEILEMLKAMPSAIEKYYSFDGHFLPAYQIEILARKE
ncbi:MAG TPA: methyltransferase domain-containing protein [Syntrophomonadaceae bacterium]|nr:methyltransferase domain-containing protein [Syntrophomonadaceae bacterium]